MAGPDFVAAPRAAQRCASRLLLALPFFVAVLAGLPASGLAMSVKDYMALPTHQQSVYSGDFIAKITGDLGRTNPRLMNEMRDWFANTDEGARRFNLELWTLQDLAKEGNADLSKIQVEAVIIDVIEQKFPPPNPRASSADSSAHAPNH